VINLSGCVLVGFLVAALVDRHSAPEWLRAGLVVGLCGGYTTFSTFAQETLDLLEARELAFAVLSVSGNVVLGVFGVVAGARLARLA
jgi:CrcB protein